MVLRKKEECQFEGVEKEAKAKIQGWFSFQGCSERMVHFSKAVCASTAPERIGGWRAHDGAKLFGLGSESTW